MDRKTLVAVVLCVAFLLFYRPLLHLVGLDRYLEPARPPATPVVDTTHRDTSAVRELAAPVSPTAPVGGIPPPASSGGRAVRTPPTPALENNFTLETDEYKATFSDRGARLLSVEFKKYAATQARGETEPIPHRPDDFVPSGRRVVLAAAPLFGLDLGAQETRLPLGDLAYTVTDSLDAAGEKRALIFTARDSGGLGVRQTWRVRPGDYALDLEVVITDVPPGWRLSDYSLTVKSWALLTDADVSADVRQLRATSLVGTNIHRESAGGLLKAPKRFDGNAQWAAVQTRYFISAVAVREGASRGVISSAERRPLTQAELVMLPRNAKPEQEVAVNSLVVGLASQSAASHRFIVYAGPTEYFRLTALGLQLERAVDLGWSWVLPFSKALLRLLNWLHGLFHNYGVAIIILATLVRVVLHPLNMMSMKSMRALQKLQPEMERIKEKYKQDAQAMNAAIMALYKENKVNPAGGCLPLVLQMPLFLALYQVLFYAIELRQAPFVGWMNDLSAPDHLFSVAGFPIRMMPILMLGSGFLSQKLTPTDPRQLPTMYLMNVFMLVFFYNLPSGLVLYWTVMNVLTAVQQWLILRQDKDAPVALPAAPEKPSKKRRVATR
jgi:YidC/Oxa1 family membrane protein insertase